jgi:peptidoglycan/xylan/chitin deacetylase (PgdA/CDA1 family)
MSSTRAAANGSRPIRTLRAAAGPLAKTALMRFGGYAVIRKVAPSKQLAILRYHAICGSQGHRYADPSICVTPTNFDAHIRYLTSAYAVLPLHEAVRAVTTGKSLPRNAVALTFDDGYADNLEAARTLARYGTTATFYITAGCLEGGEPFWPAEVRHLVAAIPPGRVSLTADMVNLELDLESEIGRTRAVKQLSRAFKSHPIPVREELRARLRDLAGQTDTQRVMLTWDEVRELRAMGMTIGSHTMTHPNLPSAGISAAREELVKSRQRLEREIDAPVTMFSYPNGGAER